jgi:hypothetical protein
VLSELLIVKNHRLVVVVAGNVPDAVDALAGIVDDVLAVSRFVYWAPPPVGEFGVGDD